MAGHLGDYSVAETYNCFGQQTLDIAASVLDFVENTFNPLADTA